MMDNNKQSKTHTQQQHLIDSIWLQTHLADNLKEKSKEMCRACAHRISKKKRWCREWEKESWTRAKLSFQFARARTFRHTFYHQLLLLLSWTKHNHFLSFGFFLWLHHHHHRFFSISICSFFGILLLSYMLNSICVVMIELEKKKYAHLSCAQFTDSTKTFQNQNKSKKDIKWCPDYIII